jgi:hypothetical protein
MASVNFSVAVKANFSIDAGRLKWLSPPGTQYLSGTQRFLGMYAGNRIAQDTTLDRIHRGGMGQATQRLQETSQRAWQDGILTRAERNQIHNAQREVGISRQKVGIDNYRKAYGNAVRDACRDGKLTPAEQRNLRGMRNHLRGMQQTLKGMQVQDRRMDRLEAVQNRFAGRQVVGFNPQKFFQNFADKLGFASGGSPGLGQIGQSILDRLKDLARPVATPATPSTPSAPTGPAQQPGYGGWQLPPYQPGYPKGSQYLSWGQRAFGMRAGGQLAKYNRGDQLHRMGAKRAHDHLRNTVNNAWRDGVLTRAERNQIANAQRHVKMADQQVKTDDYRRAYGQTYRNAFRDGVVTPQELNNLNRMRGQLGDMRGALDTMRTQDKWMDRRESIQNAFFGQQVVGFDLNKFVNFLTGG